MNLDFQTRLMAGFAAVAVTMTLMLGSFAYPTANIAGILA